MIYQIAVAVQKLNSNPLSLTDSIRQLHCASSGSSQECCLARVLYNDGYADGI